MIVITGCVLERRWNQCQYFATRQAINDVSNTNGSLASGEQISLVKIAVILAKPTFDVKHTERLGSEPTQSPRQRLGIFVNTGGNPIVRQQRQRTTHSIAPAALWADHR
jgi:hypothetical protein